MDLASENVYDLNLVRLLFFCILQPGTGNFGFLLNRDAGGSSIDPKKINDNDFHVLSLVRGRAVIIIFPMSINFILY